MFKNIFFVSILLILVSSVGCAGKSVNKESLFWDNILVNVTLTDITQPFEDSSFVYGKLSAMAKDKYLKSMDLDCIVLTSPRVTSKSISIDSVAYYIFTSNFPAKQNKISVDVYWIFDGVIQEDDLTQLQLSINKKKPNLESCATLLSP